MKHRPFPIRSPLDPPRPQQLNHLLFHCRSNDTINNQASPMPNHNVLLPCPPQPMRNQINRARCPQLPGHNHNPCQYNTITTLVAFTRSNASSDGSSRIPWQSTMIALDQCRQETNKATTWWGSGLLLCRRCFFVIACTSCPRYLVDGRACEKRGHVRLTVDRPI